MIKYNASNNVISPFNPILSLQPYIRKEVNQKFILPILNAFFQKRGGLENFEPLDNDKLKTEVEFNDIASDESFVKEYVYKEIITQIEKKDNGKVDFKPKYTISFDWDLTYATDPNFYKIGKVDYPYKSIFKNNSKEEKQIKYGLLMLGNAPILYIIFIDFQELTRFIKTIPKPKIIEPNSDKVIAESNEETKLRIFDNLIRKKEILLSNETDENNQNKIQNEIENLYSLRMQKLQGTSGEFRVNLSWQTTDDLDLHIETPDGTEIYYNNSSIHYQNVLAELDVDKNAGNDIESNPQENIYWKGVPQGKHKICVNFFAKREANKVPFWVTLITESGDGQVIEGYVDTLKQKKHVISFEFIDDELMLF